MFKPVDRTFSLQLNEARNEIKTLKKVLHRHVVALQHFQSLEGSLPQILTKHSNETRVLRGMLRDTRSCRNNLARKLHTTENRLLNTKDSLQRLQMLTHDHSLLDREDLSRKLNRATAELKEKDMRIKDLEKNLELCQGSFSRQLITEQKKITEARNISFCLQGQIHQLHREIQDLQREREKHNIYSQRLLQGFSKKGRKSKIIQTDEVIHPPTEAMSLLDLEIGEESEEETEESLEEQEQSSEDEIIYQYYNNLVQESSTPSTDISANVPLEDLQDTDTISDTSERNSSVSQGDQSKGDGLNENEASECEMEEHESDVPCIAPNCLSTSQSKGNWCKRAKNRRHYTFTQPTENLHKGIPAYYSMDSRRSGDSPHTDGFTRACCALPSV